MKKSEKALRVLAKMQELIEGEGRLMDRELTAKSYMGLLRILKMRTSGFLAGSMHENYLGEQLGKLGYEVEDLFSPDGPTRWMTDRDCREAMVLTCNKAKGLILRHAEEFEPKSQVI